MAWRSLTQIWITTIVQNVKREWPALVLSESIELKEVAQLNSENSFVDFTKTKYSYYRELGIEEEFVPEVGMVIHIEDLRWIVIAVRRVDEVEIGDEIGAYEITVQAYF